MKLQSLLITGSRRTTVGLLLGMVALIIFSGCTAKHYRKAADDETYKIVRQVEQELFGRTNEFTIATPYSNRKPAEVLPPELIFDRMQTNVRVLTIEDALNLSASTSRRYQTEKERLYLTALSLSGARYDFSPQFFAGSRAAVNRNSRGEKFGTLATDAGLTQVLKTGGRVSVGIANDLLRYYTGDPRKSVISVLSVNLTQPLLRGFGKNNPAVESFTQAERNVFYAARNFAYFQDQYALQIVNTYFDLLAQKDFIRNRYTNYLGRVQSTRRLEARADRQSITEVDQARQAELSAKNNYVNSVANFFTSLDQFKIQLGLPLGERIYLEDSTLDELEQRGLLPVPLSAPGAYKIAVDRHSQILNAIDQFEDSKRKVRVALNQLRPGLDLFANASLDSEPPTDYTRFNADDVRGGVGVELDLPISVTRERNNYRATLITFEAEIRELTLTLDNLNDSILRGLRTLEQRRQNYFIQQNALELANRRVSSTDMRIQAGQLEIRDLIEAQDAQVAAQNAVTSALVDYQEARLQLMLDIGALNTAQDKFWLQDHLAGFEPALIEAPAENFAEQPVIPPGELFTN